MRDMSPAFRRAIFDGRADYTNYLEFTFADSSTLSLDNDNIMMDGCKMEDAVSDDGVFQVGAVIVGAATFTLNNMDGSLTDYPYGGADVVWYVGMNDLDDGTDATISNGAVKMGTFYVDETEYDGHLITLHCLDYAGKLDIPFNLSAVTSQMNVMTVINWIEEAGRQAGIYINIYSIPLLSTLTNYFVTTRPDVLAERGLSTEHLENVTCRQVVSWMAQIAGCFARCNRNGSLVIDWFDTSTLVPSSSSLYGGYFDQTEESTYQSGDDADGGTFNPWNTGYVADGGSFTSYQDVDLIQSCFSQKLSMSDIEITGVRLRYKTGTGGGTDAVAEASTGTGDYVITVSDNPFINTYLDTFESRSTIQDILGFIGGSVIGMKFRAGEVTHPSDPAIEAGDVAYYWDIHGNQHSMLVSSTSFSCGVSQRTVSSAASAMNNASTRYTNTSRNYSDIMETVTQIVYPVGSIYMSVNNTSPGALFGGTWEQLPDRFLLGAGTTYTAGNTGGAATHTLATTEIPSHTHKAGSNSGYYAYGGDSTTNGPASGSGYRTSFASIDTGSAGGGQAHNNMPPYLVVYMWKRTA